MLDVLDVCCGGKMFWFDKENDRSVFCDKRKESFPMDLDTDGTRGRSNLVVCPDIKCAFEELPFVDYSFRHVVFDPPHLKHIGATSLLAKKYGMLFAGWEEMITAGFREGFRVLKTGGTMIFKWSSVEIPLSRVLSLTPEIPLYGHRSGKQSKTHWVSFLKGEPPRLAESTNNPIPAEFTNFVRRIGE